MRDSVSCSSQSTALTHAMSHLTGLLICGSDNFDSKKLSARLHAESESPAAARPHKRLRWHKSKIDYSVTPVTRYENCPQSPCNCLVVVINSLLRLLSRPGQPSDAALTVARDIISRLRLRSGITIYLKRAEITLHKTLLKFEKSFFKIDHRCHSEVVGIFELLSNRTNPWVGCVTFNSSLETHNTLLARKMGNHLEI